MDPLWQNVKYILHKVLYIFISAPLRRIIRPRGVRGALPPAGKKKREAQASRSAVSYYSESRALYADHSSSIIFATYLASFVRSAALISSSSVTSALAIACGSLNWLMFDTCLASAVRSAASTVPLRSTSPLKLCGCGGSGGRTCVPTVKGIETLMAFPLL